MRIDVIDTDDIIGITCPATGNRILWDDEDIEDSLRGSVVSAVISSLYPEECAFGWMRLAAEWNQHYASADTRKLTLDEIVESLPASGKALKIISRGMACGPLHDVTYFIVPDNFPDRCFLHSETEDDAETRAKE